MCVIIVCPKGVDVPSKDILNKAKTINRHGFGFVSESECYKTMDFDKFYRRLKRVDKEENVIIHFRYATHGSIKKDNCHPFYSEGVYFAHNGILNIIPEGDMTDSETAFKKKLIPCFKKYGFDSTNFYLYASKMSQGSKFAFMNKGKVMLIGQYYLLDGVYYSNMRFLDWDSHNRANVINM